MLSLRSVRHAIAVRTPSGVRGAIRNLLRGQTRVQRQLGTVTTLREWRVDAPPAGTVLTTHDRSTHLARIVTEFDGAAHRHALTQLVRDALDERQIPYAIVVPGPWQTPTVAVPVTHHCDAEAALTSLGSGRTPYYGVQLLPGDRTREVPLNPAVSLNANSEAIRLVEYLATADGALVAGKEFGCDIEFWAQEVPNDDKRGAGQQWVAPRPNPWIDSVDPAHTERDGQRLVISEVAEKDHLLTVNFPIDAVYTWVDGDDPEWLSSKERTLAELGRSGGNTPSRAATAGSRFASHDELRYSLRSLEMYAGWIRHIYLVTADQVPPWLVQDHPKLTIVPHRELFGDRGRLPTFNSHAIESQLHHIDGLAEHYLYLNDDVFFGRPVQPELFFLGNGMAQFFPSLAKIPLPIAGPDDPPVNWAAQRNRALLEAHSGRWVTNKLKHVPHAQVKSVLQELEESFPAEFARTAAAQFRSIDDLSITSSLAHWYGFVHGKAVPGNIRYLYTDLGNATAPQQLDWLARTRDRDTFCINDHDSSHLSANRQNEIVQGFLPRYFPLASSFEADNR